MNQAPHPLAPADRQGAPDAPLLELRDLRREFPAGEGTIAVLKDIDLAIRAGEMVAIVGQSGSGKSTLMNILGCLDRPTSGSYRVAGRATGQLGPDELAALRREYFGFIFQRYHLLGDLTARGNVEVRPSMPARCRGRAMTVRPPCWGGWAWPSAPATGPGSCRAGSSSASPSPGR